MNREDWQYKDGDLIHKVTFERIRVGDAIYVTKD